MGQVDQGPEPTHKDHLDGSNQLPFLTGQQPTSARKGFYINADGDLLAMRYKNWKGGFEEQRAPGTARTRAEPFTKFRVYKLRSELDERQTRRRTPTTTVPPTGRGHR